MGITIILCRGHEISNPPEEQRVPVLRLPCSGGRGILLVPFTSRGFKKQRKNYAITSQCPTLEQLVLTPKVAAIKLVRNGTDEENGKKKFTK